MAVPYSSVEDIVDILTPNQTAVLVIDMQNDFCNQKGVHAQRNLDVTGAPAMADKLVAFLNYCRTTHPDVKIFHTVTRHSKWDISPAYAHVFKSLPQDLVPICMVDTWGTEIWDEYPALQPRENEYLVTKHRYSAFINTDLSLILRSQGITTLIATGGSTNCCVAATVYDGHMLDYHMVVPRDLTITPLAALQEPTLQNIQRYFGDVVTSEQIKTAWNIINDKRR